MILKKSSSKLLKQLYFLGFLFVLSSRLSLPFSFYILNYEYISEELCINRWNKEILCNGKCFLSKQLNQEEHQHEKTSQKIVLNFDLFYDTKSSILDTFISLKNTIKPQFRWQLFYTFDFNFQLLKPPIS